MKRVLLLPALFLLIALPINSISYRIALSDFAVHSDNTKYRNMGKGISEMIAVELAKSTDVDLIKREKRAEVLEEMEFALSDLAPLPTVASCFLLCLFRLLTSLLTNIDPTFLLGEYFRI